MAESKSTETEKAYEAWRKKLAEDIAEICEIPSGAGKRVLNEIKRRSGLFQKGVVFLPNGDIATNAMLYNEGRRCLWLELREFIDQKHLKEIEGKNA